MNRKIFIVSVLGAALCLFAAGAWYANRPDPASALPRVSPQVAEALVRPHAPILGPSDAPVTIVEFFDPACETCRAFYPVLKDIMAEHGKAVRVVIRYAPFHGEASREAIGMLEAARAQGIFEPVKAALLRQQPLWATHGAMRPDRIAAIAAAEGLDLAAAAAQMRTPQVVAALKQDLADIAAAGVRQTPTFFVNGRPLYPFGEAELRALVAGEVDAAGG